MSMSHLLNPQDDTSSTPFQFSMRGTGPAAGAQSSYPSMSPTLSGPFGGRDGAAYTPAPAGHYYHDVPRQHLQTRPLPPGAYPGDYAYAGLVPGTGSHSPELIANAWAHYDYQARAVQHAYAGFRPGSDNESPSAAASSLSMLARLAYDEQVLRADALNLKNLALEHYAAHSAEAERIEEQHIAAQIISDHNLARLAHSVMYNPDARRTNRVDRYLPGRCVHSTQAQANAVIDALNPGRTKITRIPALNDPEWRLDLIHDPSTHTSRHRLLTHQNPGFSAQGHCADAFIAATSPSHSM